MYVHGLSQKRGRAQFESKYFWSCIHFLLDYPHSASQDDNIESKVGIFNNFVVLSNRVLKLNIEKNCEIEQIQGTVFIKGSKHFPCL